MNSVFELNLNVLLFIKFIRKIVNIVLLICFIVEYFVLNNSWLKLINNDLKSK